MGAKKVRDIAVKTGSYQDQSTGETKGRYQNVGAVMKNEDGSIFIMLARWFNPAGIPSDRDTILLSCFELKDQQELSGGGRRNTNTRSSNQRQSSQNDDQDIPF